MTDRNTQVTGPGKLAMSQVALLPDGSAAEVVLDVDGNAFARCQVVSGLRTRAWWSEWWPLGSGAVSVCLAPSAEASRASGKASGHVTVATPEGRTVYLLTTDGPAGTGL